MNDLVWTYRGKCFLHEIQLKVGIVVGIQLKHIFDLLQRNTQELSR
jgi:hypothetical protein